MGCKSSASESTFALCEHAHVNDGQTHHVPPCIFANTERDARIVASTRSGRSIRKCAVQYEGFSSIDVGDVDEGLVQRVVTSIADQIFQILLVIVLVTTTGAVILAKTQHGQ